MVLCTDPLGLAVGITTVLPAGCILAVGQLTAWRMQFA